jgi:hypothetical protein
LAVNGVAEATAGVTLTGTGISAVPLTYVGPYSISGQTYAEYDSLYFPSLLTSGGTYTLTSITSIGTATASLTMPSLANIASDGSGTTWTGPSMSNWVFVFNTSGTTYSSTTCPAIYSPFSIPSSAYPAPGNYAVGQERINFTSSITGGTGLFYVYSFIQINVTK